ncbi:MAG TPA: methyltransferase domain-containing protein [Thermoleophilaceae bacterium]|nr:methyltransferase domain-containing protein [Thermoleophilaceae bacterium]
MSGSHMERYWDARAREDAFYFVDSRLAYRSPDEEAFWKGGEEALDRLLDALGAELRPDGVIVDVGCGVGRLTRPLAERVRQVIALDVSSEMLTRARELNSELDNVEWVHGDGETLAPLADGSVDACVSHVVFRHIPDPAITLGYVREMGRVLRPGGFAAFELSNDPTPHRDAGRPLSGRLASLLGRAPRGQRDRAWLGSYVDRSDLERTAAGAGLVLEAIHGAGTEFCAVLLRRRAEDIAESAGSDVRSYYDRYWAAPVTPSCPLSPQLEELVFDGVTSATRCLDVGCGAGNSYAPALAARTGSYTGVDVSHEAVERARAAGLDAHLIDDASSLPFEDGAFDLVVCIEVLEHLFSPGGAVAEIRRLLAPGGRLVVSVPNAAYWRLRTNLLAGVWNPLGDERSVEAPWRDPHIRFFTVSALERMLRQAGFGSVEAGAHGGRFLDHLSSRATDFGDGRTYRALESRFPSLLGMTIHAVARP